MAKPWVLVPGAWSTAGFFHAILPTEVLKTLHIEPLPECRDDSPPKLWGRWPTGKVWMFERLLNASQQGPIVLIAHSFGAQYALAFAHAYPARVHRLILMAPALGQNWGRGTFFNIVGLLRYSPRTWWARLMLAPTEFTVQRHEIFSAQTLPEGMRSMPRLLPALLQLVTIARACIKIHPPLPVGTLVIRPTDDGFVPPYIPEHSTTKVWDVRGGHFMFMKEAALWVRIQSWLAQHGIH